jgi:peptide/nickel transport system permease protein
MQYTKTKVANMNSILSIVLKRLLIGLLPLWIVTVIVLAAIELLPGDVATEMLGQAATEKSVAAFREKFDLNCPLHVAISRGWQGPQQVTSEYRLPIKDLSRTFSGNALPTLFLSGIRRGDLRSDCNCVRNDGGALQRLCV